MKEPITYELAEDDPLSISLHTFLETLQESPAKPREKLQRHGHSALSLSEILAIILSTGSRGKSVFQLADQLLSHFGSERNLYEASLPELLEIEGIGIAKALRLQAAFALRRRYEDERFQVVLMNPSKVFEMFQSEFCDQQQEMLIVILRDGRGRYMSHQQVSLGTLNELLVHPREIYHPAVRQKASSIIILHNHPSGELTPSPADISMTRRLAYCGQLLAIPLLDHLIIANGRYLSLLESGFLGKKSSTYLQKQNKQAKRMHAEW